MAMIRSQQGIHDSILKAFLGGPQLSWLGTLSRMAKQYAPFLEGQTASAIPILFVWAALIWAVWRIPSPGRPVVPAGPPQADVSSAE